MRQILVGLNFMFYILSVGMPFASADIVVVTDSNKIPKFVLDTATGKVTAVNGVYVEGGVTQPPVPPVNPDDPDTDKYSAINSKLTQTQGEGLTFMLHALTQQNIVDLENSLKETVGILDLFVKSGGAYDRWLKDVLALGPPNLNEIVTSLVKSFNVNLDDFNTAKSGGVPSQEYAFDWAVWLPIILKIIEYLFGKKLIR